MSDDLENIDPYKVLGVDKSSSHLDCKKAFRKLINSKNFITKKKGALAYDILCNKNNYIKKGDLYTPKKKDHFYYVTIGDLKHLELIYKKNKKILKEKDKLERNLLYIAARNGYSDICEFLLEEGMDPNETQKTNSTPLHGAAFYNQLSVCKLLLEYGARGTLENLSGNLAIEESCSNELFKIIHDSLDDKITCLLNKLIAEKIAKRLILVKYRNMIIGKKILRDDSLLPENIDYIKKNWVVGWHGTQFEFLESIMKHGLYPSGTKLSDGTDIKPLPGHIPLKTSLAGFDDWAKAVFVSPSIFYAGHPVYAKRINSNNIEYSVVIETRIKPETFSKHPPTVVQYVGKSGEPNLVEYRIEVKDDSDLIMRIESQLNVIVTGILFAKTDFLKNIKDYYQGELFVNSKEEKNLFITKY